MSQSSCQFLIRYIKKSKSPKLHDRKHQPTFQHFQQQFEKMPMLQQFIPFTWKLRHYFVSKIPDGGVRAWRYSKLVEEALTIYEKEDELIPQVIEDFISKSCVVNKGSSSSEHVKTIQKNNLLHNSNKRAYRVVIGSDMMDGEDDNRVREVLSYIIKKSSISLYPFLCNFFCDRGVESRKSMDDKDFTTTISTRFEQLLFCSMINYILTENGKKKKNNNKNEKNDDTGNIPLFKSDRRHGQYVGWGIQQVVNGWDSFSRMIGFIDTEQMFLPYLLLNEDGLKFTVLSDKTEGYIPVENWSCIRFPILPTTKEDCIPTYLKDMSDDIDKFLRDLCCKFLKDIQDIVLLNDLYSKTNVSGIIEVQKFIQRNNELPTRFDDICFMNICNAKDEIRKLLPNNYQVTKRKGSNQLAVSSRKSRKIEEVGYNIISKEEPEMIPISVGGRRTKKKNPYEIEKNITLGGMDETSSILKMERYMQQYSSLYLCEFQQLMECHETLNYEMLDDMVQLVLTDPPYNIRRERGKVDSEYDSITINQMKQVVQTIRNVLRPGGHGIVFCSYQQHQQWMDLFNDEKETNGTSNDVFSVDMTPLLFVRDNSNFTTNPTHRNSSTLVNSVEYAGHVKKNGLSSTEEASMINLRGFNHVRCTLQGFRNVIDNVSGLLPGEQVRYFNHEYDEWKAIRCEQKSIALMKELVCRFTQPGDIVLDLFGGTFSTGIACFQIDQHRRFIGCEKERDCFEISRDNVVRRFSEMLIHGSSDIKMTEEVMKVANEIVCSESFKEVARPNWVPPSEFSLVQSFPIHIITYISTVWNDSTIYEEFRNLPLMEWNEKYQSRFEKIWNGNDVKN